MPHIHHPEAKKTMGDKLERIIGKRGEYPPDKAVRILGRPFTNASAQGDAARLPPEEFTAAPPRQVGDQGSVKGD